MILSQFVFVHNMIGDNLGLPLESPSLSSTDLFPQFGWSSIASHLVPPAQ